MRVITKSNQAYGAFNNGQIIENKPIGFPQDKGFVRPYASLFYWARAEAVIDSTIGLHPHKGFEIMSFVLDGRIRHFDTQLNDWKPLEAGDVQVIRAGSGISHAEQLDKDAVIFQIWLDPDLGKTLEQEASYSDYKSTAFTVTSQPFGKATIYAGDQGLMSLDTPDVDIRKLELTAGEMIWPGEERVIRSLYVLDGSGSMNGQSVERDDFVILDEGSDLHVTHHPGSMNVFAISLPARPPYATYAERMRI